MSNASITPTPNSDNYELSVIHPATAKWLTDAGYTFEHEVYMKDYGRADFIAAHPTGQVLIIECKKDAHALSRTINQVSDYRQQYDRKAQIVIALPAYTVTDKVRELLERRKAGLIELSVPPKIERALDQWEIDQANKNAAGLIDALLIIKGWVERPNVDQEMEAHADAAQLAVFNSLINLHCATSEEFLKAYAKRLVDENYGWQR